MDDKHKLAAPCGLYCGVCGVYVAHRETCPIRSCTIGKGIEGCHQCSDFPCTFIEGYPIPVSKKVILRAIPAWRELGTERWMEEEERRYHCPQCGYGLFRGAKRCRDCGSRVDVD